MNEKDEVAAVERIEHRMCDCDYPGLEHNSDLCPMPELLALITQRDRALAEVERLRRELQFFKAGLDAEFEAARRRLRAQGADNTREVSDE